MANKHRAKIAKREEFDKYWSLPQFRNPRVKFFVTKCDICHPKINKRLIDKRYDSMLKDYRQQLEIIGD